jgi:hypothetical protein
MTRYPEQRRADRLHTNIPVAVEKIGRRELPLHPVLVPIYERVEPNLADLGLKFPGALLDLSQNGCFISGPPLALLSRVALRFALSGFGQIDALGWVMWRRSSDAEIPVGNGSGGREGKPALVLVKAGFGLLFEAIALEARGAIARMVAERKG